MDIVTIIIKAMLYFMFLLAVYILCYYGFKYLMLKVKEYVRRNEK